LLDLLHRCGVQDRQTLEKVHDEKAILKDTRSIEEREFDLFTFFPSLASSSSSFKNFISGIFTLVHQTESDLCDALALFESYHPTHTKKETPVARLDEMSDCALLQTEYQQCDVKMFRSVFGNPLSMYVEPLTDDGANQHDAIHAASSYGNHRHRQSNQKRARWMTTLDILKHDNPNNRDHKKPMFFLKHRDRDSNGIPLFADDESEEEIGNEAFSKICHFVTVFDALYITVAVHSPRFTFTKKAAALDSLLNCGGIFFGVTKKYYTPPLPQPRVVVLAPPQQNANEQQLPTVYLDDIKTFWNLVKVSAYRSRQIFTSFLWVMFVSMDSPLKEIYHAIVGTVICEMTSESSLTSSSSSSSPSLTTSLLNFFSMFFNREGRATIFSWFTTFNENATNFADSSSSSKIVDNDNNMIIKLKPGQSIGEFPGIFLNNMFPQIPVSNNNVIEGASRCYKYSFNVNPVEIFSSFWKDQERSSYYYDYSLFVMIVLIFFLQFLLSSRFTSKFIHGGDFYKYPKLMVRATQVLMLNLISLLHTVVIGKIILSFLIQVCISGFVKITHAIQEVSQQQRQQENENTATANNMITNDDLLPEYFTKTILPILYASSIILPFVFNVIYTSVPAVYYTAIVDRKEEVKQSTTSENSVVDSAPNKLLNLGQNVYQLRDVSLFLRIQYNVKKYFSMTAFSNNNEKHKKNKNNSLNYSGYVFFVQYLLLLFVSLELLLRRAMMLEMFVWICFMEIGCKLLS
jgi:hypothetical protein